MELPGSNKTRPSQQRRAGAGQKVGTFFAPAVSTLDPTAQQLMDSARKPSLDWGQFLGPEALCSDGHLASLDALPETLESPTEQFNFGEMLDFPSSQSAPPTMLNFGSTLGRPNLLTQSTKRKASQEVVQGAGSLRASKRGKDRQMEDTIVINGEVYERRRRLSSPPSSPPPPLPSSISLSERQNLLDTLAMSVDRPCDQDFHQEATNFQPQSPLFSGHSYSTPNRNFRLSNLLNDSQSSNNYTNFLVDETANLELNASPTPRRTIKALPNKLGQSTTAPTIIPIGTPSEIDAEMTEFPPFPLNTISDLARDAIHELEAIPDFSELASSPSTSVLSPDLSGATSPGGSSSAARPKRNRKRQPPKGTPQPAMSADATHMIHIARPPNAFILYRSDQLRLLKSDAVVSARPQASISKLIGALWRQEKKPVKDWYERQSQVKKDEHARLHPDYRFSPQKKEEKKAATPKGRKKLSKSTNTIDVPTTRESSPSPFPSIGLGRPSTMSRSLNVFPVFDAVATPRNISATTRRAQSKGPASSMGSTAPTARFMPRRGRRSASGEKRNVSGESNAGFNDVELQALLNNYENSISQVASPVEDEILVQPSSQYPSMDFINQAWQEFNTPNGLPWFTPSSAEAFAIDTPSSTISTPFSGTETSHWLVSDQTDGVDSWLKSTEQSMQWDGTKSANPEDGTFSNAGEYDWTGQHAF